MSPTPTAPALFISHGAPTFALEPGELGHALGALGQHLQEVRGIVAVSAHWQTPELHVANTEQPDTIHDFYGFPPALYALRYPASGSAEITQRVMQALHASNLAAQLDHTHGMDHGVWVPLLHLRPQADIPVVCVSLPVSATPHSAWQLGQALAKLRQEGVMIMGTGSLTHNLSEFRGPAVTQTAPYVTAFTTWIQTQIQNRNLSALCQYRTLAPEAKRAHPTEEHLLPLFVALGASSDTDAFDVLATEVRYGMLSMASYHWH